MKKEAKKSMAMSNLLNVIIDDEIWPENIIKKAEKVFAAAIEYLQKNNLGKEIAFGKPIVVNLSLSNNETVQKLNAEFRGMDKPTNVLSFANIDSECFFDDIKKSDQVEMGDIIIAFETLQNEAQQKHISLEDHFAHLLVHGILHLFGYDHQEDEEAEEMEQFEIKILQQLNINNPYEEQ